MTRGLNSSDPYAYMYRHRLVSRRHPIADEVIQPEVPPVAAAHLWSHVKEVTRVSAPCEQGCGCDYARETWQWGTEEVQSRPLTSP